MGSLLDKEKPKNPAVDWSKPEDRERYLKTRKPKEVKCPMIDEKGYCMASYDVPRRNGEIVPQPCSSIWFDNGTCSIYSKYKHRYVDNVGGLKVNGKNT